MEEKKEETEKKKKKTEKEGMELKLYMRKGKVKGGNRKEENEKTK